MMRVHGLGLTGACTVLVACAGGGGSTDAGTVAPVAAGASHSSSIALSSDGAKLYVVNADADSVSVIDTVHRTLDREILVAPTHPALDSNGAYTPHESPRSLALSRDERTLFVAGQRSGRVHAIDLATNVLRRSDYVGSEPAGMVVSPDGRSVFVACMQDATVVRLDADTLAVTGRATLAAGAWSLAWSRDGSRLFASRFLAPGVSVIDPVALTVASEWRVPDVAPRGERRLAHGEARGLYDVAVRPGSTEVWVAHSLLGTDTAQPALDFESTVFPALTVLHDDGAFVQTLSTDAQPIAGVDGAIPDVVSGPHAIAFTRDGALALVVDSNSEDVLVMDAQRRIERSVLRPLPGHQPEGIVLSNDERSAYVDERNTNDVAVLRLDRSGSRPQLTVDGSAIARLATDPMPAQLRAGQHLFYSANSDEFPITRNHWVACSSCHMEGRSDAVTWRFAQGPRDTPSNAGGETNTGFLFRTGDRTSVRDYWHTINVEQGGRFDPTDATQLAQLDAITAYVNFAIPLPVAPTTDAALVARGRVLFDDPVVACASCHSGPRFTDSGEGNPTLDLTGPVLLHDVGTCVTTGAFPDVAHDDVDGHPRGACAFDTPSLNGLAASAPFLHDGSAATIRDVLENTRGRMGDIRGLSAGDEDALIEYLRSL